MFSALTLTDLNTYCLIKFTSLIIDICAVEQHVLLKERNLSPLKYNSHTNSELESLYTRSHQNLAREDSSLVSMKSW